MTDLTMPSLRPVTDPCAARHCEAPAVYGPGAGPEAAEAERLERMARGGPGALASHELLALLGVRIDAPDEPLDPDALLAEVGLPARAIRALRGGVDEPGAWGAAE